MKNYIELMKNGYLSPHGGAWFPLRPKPGRVPMGERGGSAEDPRPPDEILSPMLTILIKQIRRAYGPGHVRLSVYVPRSSFNPPQGEVYLPLPLRRGALEPKCVGSPLGR